MIDYSPDADNFNDPIVRCTDCKELVHRIYIAEKGGCNHCGCRRVKNVMAIKPEEMQTIVDGTANFSVPKEKWHPMDQDFLNLFEEDE